MKRSTAVIFGIWAVATVSAGAQQTPTGSRAALNFGVPKTTHQDIGCTHEDQKAAANGWNLAFGLGIYRTCQAHVVAPTRTVAVKPMYTPAAMAAKIEGTVVLAAVIKEDGSIGEVRVLQSLDKVNGLDDNAIDSVRRSEFTPGRLGARSVPVVVMIEQQFVLR